MELLTLILAAGTIALALITRSQVLLSAKIGKTQLRGYVHVAAAKIDITDKSVPVAHVTIKNFGNTPAYSVKHLAGMTIGDYPLTRELAEPPAHLPGSSSTIGPGSHTRLEIVRTPPIPAALQSHLGTLTGTVYVYGVITYKDVFRDPHTTKYRMIWGGPEPSKDGTMSHDAEGDYAD